MIKLLIKILLVINSVINILGKNDIEISVVIPVHNTENYLRRSIQSVLNQTLKEIEIICVDDASTDNSLGILEEFRKNDSRVKVYHFEENHGPSMARNKGIDMASGEFIGFMDDDDFMDERFYENLYKYSKDADVVVGIFVLSTNLSSSYLHHSKWRPHGSVFDSIFRKNFLDKYNVRFQNNMRIGEDIKFRLDCYKYNPRIIEIPDEGIYYYYKQREGSAMNFNKNFIKKIDHYAKRETKKRKKEIKKKKKEMKKGHN
ncbi:nucleotide-diphospho-sugar transferase [Neocallimastix californiae]|uniref:Nucleotide-diphospho-sugar transferase n=1 Tax=Neocallimastix californiae TaxID=1754190 RepID=A0A1Y2AVW5_9FUNG|nr:nucleotide-diphospho-sugar transferase [Neocallimastix californiae]|eukprot:ORY26733.1 nucleotide-diphospho-sugar transferase [Neocallimastix californiae]